MSDMIHDPSGMRSTVPDYYDAAFILREAGNPNHSGWVSNGNGTKLIAYHPNDQVVVSDIINGYEALYVEKVAKPALWAEVRALRNTKENAPAITPLGPVDSDDTSKTKVLGLVLLAMLAKQTGNTTFSEEFTMADNSVVTLNADMAIGLGMALGKSVSVIHARSRVLRDAIAAATTLADLGAIDINAGW